MTVTTENKILNSTGDEKERAIQTLIYPKIFPYHLNDLWDRVIPRMCWQF